MRLILVADDDYRRKNLFIADEVTLIFPDELNGASRRDILLAEHTNDDRGPRNHPVTYNHPAYMSLHYMLLFPDGHPG